MFHVTQTTLSIQPLLHMYIYKLELVHNLQRGNENEARNI